MKVSPSKQLCANGFIDSSPVAARCRETGEEMKCENVKIKQQYNPIFTQQLILLSFISANLSMTFSYDGSFLVIQTEFFV